MDQERFVRYIRPVGSVMGTIVLVLAAAGTVAARNGVDRSAGDLRAVPDHGVAVAAEQQTGDPTALSPAQASPDSVTAGTRPGWGCGDVNHDHSGPPGNPDATSPCLNAAQPSPDPVTGGSRPGWGCGDTNHEHSGPPGNSGATNPCDKAGSPAEDETQDRSEDIGSAADEARNDPAIPDVRRGPPAHSAAGGNKPAKPEKADKPSKPEQAQTKARGPDKK